MGLGNGQRRRSGVNTQLVMLGVGALAVLAVALAFAAVPGPAPIAGADDGAPRAATYKGVDYCKTCHGPGGFGGDQYTGWETTNHGLDFTARDYHGSPINMFNRSGGSCQKCHVVGYNQTAIDGWDPAQAWDGTHNSKLQGIQCEACHGPGSAHSGGETGIISRPTPAQSCAGDSQQGCHGPNPGHLTVPAWNVSAHSPAKVQGAAKPEPYQNTYCAKCHSPSQWDSNVNSSSTAKNITAEEYRSVECADCHDMHNGTNDRELTRPIDATCTKCHTADKTAVRPGASPGHRTQKEMFLGTMGANVTGSKGMPGVTCADCHMWTTPSPARGYYLSDIPSYPYEFNQGHEFKASAEACADCHSDLILSMPNFTMPANNAGANATAYAAWEKWLPLWENEVEVWETVIDDWQNQIKPLLASATENATAAKAAIDSAKANKTKDADTIARATELWGDAYWNYKLVEADSNYGVHNYVYASDLLNDALSKSRQALALINANSAPLANAGPSRVADAGEPVAFDASASSDMDGNIASYFWDFGDGANSTDKLATHTYAESGLYTVKLTVTDNLNAASTASINVFVNKATDVNIAPVAVAGNDQTATPGTKVGFNGSGSSDADGTMVAYSWSFGDGTSGTGATAEHTYAGAGVYAVVLIVTDDKGASAFDVAIVSVMAPPAPPVDLIPLQNNLTALKADLGNTTSAVNSVKTDTASVKKDVSDTKKEVSDTKKAVDALAGDLGLYMTVVLLIALVAALVLYMLAMGRTVALEKKVDALRPEEKKDG